MNNIIRLSLFEMITLNNITTVKNYSNNSDTKLDYLIV